MNVNNNRRYNTFEAGDDINDNLKEPQYSQSLASTQQTSEYHQKQQQPLTINNNDNNYPYHYEYEQEDDYNNYSSCDEDDSYGEFGMKYRQFCFSSNGIKFSIGLNILMVVINTILIVYEIVLMIKSHSFTTYYDAQLPLIYSVIDILLTSILLIEISLHLTAIYKCHICNYFKYSHDHKIDILVFLLSLFLCILYLFNLFGASDMDNISFLVVRIFRDIMRVVRCVIFAKFLYDSYVQLAAPKRSKTRNRRKRIRRHHSHSHSHSHSYSYSYSITDDNSCSSGWDHLKTDKQHQFVCV